MSVYIDMYFINMYTYVMYYAEEIQIYAQRHPLCKYVCLYIKLCIWVYKICMCVCEAENACVSTDT